ncbi:Transposase DDE domain-containing protein [Anaerovirgula multivorans]|uniref:Transposase DDE domain-containing protein n=1 Tax=Anaerovirgula multivorans TaxID=312168 RepID=A0A239KXB1_9FIRM|nr:IS982 family transposase [Anaerovirgula multivorans]SNT22695.1 Transposase DDE domain-containing protein [Anaerovirgula multivorans]
MLELTNKYSIKEIGDLKDFITVTYVVIDDIYQRITPTYIKERKNINESILSDSEIITISIVGELLTIDSENAWFGFCKKNLSDLFPSFCHRTRFNRTRRALHAIIEEIRKEITSMLGFNGNPYRIIDSIPIPVCKFGRARFHKTFRGYGASYGRCPSKKETYFGYKLHMLVGLDGYVIDFALTPADIDDRRVVWELLESYDSITVLGDKGYINSNLSSELKHEKNIDLLPLQRKNSKIQYSKALRQVIFKLRRRIETTASQLSEQLNIEKVLAKSLWGLTTRIKTKVLGYNLCHFMNRILGKTSDLAKIKDLIFG